MKDLLGDIAAHEAQPPAPWLGGKRLLAKRIAKRIAGVKHEIYVEPFVGMGGVFLRRPFKAHSEVINDINGELVNLFRILQRHYPQFMDCLKFQVASRREFERLRAADPATLTDLERAARFLYLQRLAFGGKSVGQTFGVSVGMPARFDINRLGPMLADVHERLSSVVIENLSWPEVIDRYDTPDTLFYLDPPYWDCENDYGQGVFSKSDFRLIAEKLAKIDGRFLLSLNDVPGVRTVFEAFEFERVELNYSISSGGGKQVTEVIISS